MADEKLIFALFTTICFTKKFSNCSHPTFTGHRNILRIQCTIEMPARQAVRICSEIPKSYKTFTSIKVADDPSKVPENIEPIVEARDGQIGCKEMFDNNVPIPKNRVENSWPHVSQEFFTMCGQKLNFQIKIKHLTKNYYF